jgi:hypothetical protein
MAVCPTAHVLRIETDEQWEQSAVSLAGYPTPLPSSVVQGH